MAEGPSSWPEPALQSRDHKQKFTSKGRDWAQAARKAGSSLWTERPGKTLVGATLLAKASEGKVGPVSTELGVGRAEPVLWGGGIAEERH